MAPILLLSASLVCAQSATDSTRSRTIILKASLAASYTTSRNWQTADFQNYAFSGGLFVQDVGQRTERRHQHQLLADLSYLKFIDSTWNKGTDRFLLNLLWSRTVERWTHSYSVLCYTQFMPNEVLAYDASAERMRTERYGGVLVPGGLELGYGATWYPWEGSSVQFSFATAKVLCTAKRSLQDTSAGHMAYTANAVIDMQYGGAVVVNINHPLNDRVDWINASRVFCNAFDRDHVSFELVNRFAVKLWTYVQLRFDTRLGYDPLVSYDLRFSQEVLLGVFYEKQRSK